MSAQNVSVDSAGVKIATVWGAVGISSWADAAGAVATLYSLCLLCEWVWKKFLRAAMERRGLVKPRKRRAGDVMGEVSEARGYGDK